MFVSSKSVAAVGDRSLVRVCAVTTELDLRVCDVTTELDCRVEGSDGARNSIAQNSINLHRTRNQITQIMLLGNNKVFYQTNRETDKYAERKTAKQR